mgnify:CR=1 FL=1
MGSTPYDVTQLMTSLGIGGAESGACGGRARVASPCPPVVRRNPPRTSPQTAGLVCLVAATVTSSGSGPASPGQRGRAAGHVLDRGAAARADRPQGHAPPAVPAGPRGRVPEHGEHPCVAGGRARCDLASSLTRPDESRLVDGATEAKLQILCHLANFAYDPINYQHLRDLNVITLFLGALGAAAGRAPFATGLTGCSLRSIRSPRPAPDCLTEADQDPRFVEFAMAGLCNLALGAAARRRVRAGAVPLRLMPFRRGQSRVAAGQTRPTRISFCARMASRRSLPASRAPTHTSSSRRSRRWTFS